MTAADLVAALQPIVEALEALGVSHMVGGSLASSVHGVPRTSIDGDLVADLEPQHVAPLLQRLAGGYYVDEARVRAAIEARRSFNMIHLQTMFKIDVFVMKQRPFDRQALQRASLDKLTDAPEARRFLVASAEDTVLAKLEWFRKGGEVSDRQWADVVGVLKTSPGLDHQYLQRWSAELGVSDLLEKAVEDASGGG